LPKYGSYWDKLPRFCLQHRHDHHIDVRSPARHKYNGLAANGTRLLDLRNIPVVEDPSVPDNSDRLFRSHNHPISRACR